MSERLNNNPNTTGDSTPSGWDKLAEMAPVASHDTPPSIPTVEGKKVVLDEDDEEGEMTDYDIQMENVRNETDLVMQAQSEKIGVKAFLANEGILPASEELFSKEKRLQDEAINKVTREMAEKMIRREMAPAVNSDLKKHIEELDENGRNELIISLHKMRDPEGDTVPDMKVNDEILFSFALDEYWRKMRNSGKLNALTDKLMNGLSDEERGQLREEARRITALKEQAEQEMD